MTQVVPVVPDDSNLDENGEPIVPIVEEVDETDDTEETVVPVPPPAPVPPERPVHTIPLSKYNEDKEKAERKGREAAKAEAQTEIDRLTQALADAKSSDTRDAITEELERVSEEHNIDPEAAKALLGVFKKAIPVQTPEINNLLEQQQTAVWKTKVSEEFDASVAPLILKDYPQATPEHIRNVKERIEELAFSEGFNTYRLEDIYQVKKSEFEFKNGYSAESAAGSQATFIDFGNITDEQEIELADKDPETYKKLIKWQKSHSSRFLT